MAWVAFDRAACEPEAHAINRSGKRWRAIADEIHAEICERGFDRDLDSFVQAYGSKRLDASLLLIPLVGFLAATDARVQGTLRAIENNLLVDREFLLRYETDNPADGLPSGEGAFLACSFWLVDNYILQGRVTEARQLFNRLLSHCNDVGLLSEQFDPVTGRMLGNFPQAFTRVGLINSALNLNRHVGCPAEERTETPMTRSDEYLRQFRSSRRMGDSSGTVRTRNLRTS
jgi:GH15 family glucan-1,4-alpha-glucosidase